MQLSTNDYNTLLRIDWSICRKFACCKKKINFWLFNQANIPIFALVEVLIKTCFITLQFTEKITNEIFSYSLDKNTHKKKNLQSFP